MNLFFDPSNLLRVSGHPSVHVLLACRDQKKTRKIFRSDRVKVSGEGKGTG